MKHFKILFSPEGGDGSGGGQAGADGGQDGQGGGSDGGDGGSADTKINERISYLESELTKVVNEKTELKQKLKDKENAELTEKEQWKELADKKDVEITELTAKLSELDAIKEERDKIKAEREEEIKQQREVLLSQLSDEDKTVAEELSLPKLQAYVAKHGKKNGADVDNGQGSGESTKLTDEEKKHAAQLNLDEKSYKEVMANRKVLEENLKNKIK